mmetsp:Transcript_10025/g.40767  ORF Transcript_10025/g.40767 Transcript_10025/m.40767 type:complete len:223 (-) Transcript_10025:4765-5433(-)
MSPSASKRPKPAALVKSTPTSAFTVTSSKVRSSGAPAPVAATRIPPTFPPSNSCSQKSSSAVMVKSATLLLLPATMVDSVAESSWMRSEDWMRTLAPAAVAETAMSPFEVKVVSSPVLRMTRSRAASIWKSRPVKASMSLAPVKVTSPWSRVRRGTLFCSTRSPSAETVRLVSSPVTWMSKSSTDTKSAVPREVMFKCGCEVVVGLAEAPTSIVKVLREVAV